MKCGFSNLKSDMFFNEKGRAPEVKLKCDDTSEYISSKIMGFGLLYKDDTQTGSISSGRVECDYINSDNPNVSKDSFMDEKLRNHADCADPN